ncbi:autoimmune regulator-like [Sphaerodactylus townsendi]|uniref:autoimmune regulator-like n=1 Tax=Sphaerodactylus townsendi TaxID=933632 RepID=UPI002027004A|nr:autoimmune regulator-like [Sphaerodactylus townsendi]
MFSSDRPLGEGDLRKFLKLYRTEISMAVDDVFPLLHGLVDHDVVTEEMFKDTIHLKEKDGCHKAFHAMLTWLLCQESRSILGFWRVLFKDYNLERYSKLQSIRSSFPRDMDLGKNRRARKLPASPKILAQHKSQGKRKATEEKDPSCHPQPLVKGDPHLECCNLYCGSTGTLPKAKTAKKAENTEIQRCLLPNGDIKKCIKVGGEFYSKLEEPGERNRAQEQKPSVKAKESQAPEHKEELEVSLQGKCPTISFYTVDPAFQQVMGIRGTWRCNSCCPGKVKQDMHTEEDSSRQQLSLDTLILYGQKTTEDRKRVLLKDPAGGPYRQPLPPASSVSVAVLPSVQSVGAETQLKLTIGEKCGVCRKGGDMICCSKCFRSFHWHCHFPAHADQISGILICKSCSGSHATITMEGGPALRAIKQEGEVTKYGSISEDSLTIP